MLTIQPRNEPARVVRGRIFLTWSDEPDKWRRYADNVPLDELAQRVADLNRQALEEQSLYKHAFHAIFKGVEC